MAVKLIVAPEALLDMDEAYGWYERQRTGLGEEVLGCIDACIQAICRTPEMYAKAHDNYRRGLVRRFPYVVFYEATEETVTVYGVFHTSQDSKKWRQRLM